MSRENVEIVWRVFEASARRDADAVLALYDPDVNGMPLGPSPDSSTSTGGTRASFFLP
jgi:ketosteroid isomerase-like protein